MTPLVWYRRMNRRLQNQGVVDLSAVLAAIGLVPKPSAFLMRPWCCNFGQTSHVLVIHQQGGRMTPMRVVMNNFIVVGLNTTDRPVQTSIGVEHQTAPLNGYGTSDD